MKKRTTGSRTGRLKGEEMNISQEDFEKLKRENEVLKKRCFAWTRGILCQFCRIDCSQRSKVEEDSKKD